MDLQSHFQWQTHRELSPTLQFSSLLHFKFLVPSFFSIFTVWFTLTGVVSPDAGGSFFSGKALKTHWTLLAQHQKAKLAASQSGAFNSLETDFGQLNPELKRD